MSSVRIVLSNIGGAWHPGHEKIKKWKTCHRRYTAMRKRTSRVRKKPTPFFLTKRVLWIHLHSFLFYPTACPYQISGSNSNCWLENRPLKIRFGMKSEQYFGGRSRAHFWHIENEILWGTSQGQVWPRKCGSTQFYFISSLVQGVMVSLSNFFTRTPKPLQKKKHVGPFFFSCSVYLCGS